MKRRFRKKKNYGFPLTDAIIAATNDYSEKMYVKRLRMPLPQRGVYPSGLGETKSVVTQ